MLKAVGLGPSLGVISSVPMVEVAQAKLVARGPLKLEVFSQRCSSPAVFQHIRLSWPPPSQSTNADPVQTRAESLSEPSEAVLRTFQVLPPSPGEAFMFGVQGFGAFLCCGSLRRRPYEFAWLVLDDPCLSCIHASCELSTLSLETICKQWSAIFSRCVSVVQGAVQL